MYWGKSGCSRPKWYYSGIQHNVSLLHGFVQFGGAPGARQRPLLVGLRTLLGLSFQGSVQLVFQTGPTQWEGQFIPCAIGQDGMVQAKGRQHGTFGQNKVRMVVHGVGGVGRRTGVPAQLGGDRCDAGVIRPGESSGRGEGTTRKGGD